jgi:hypothetical protein
MSNPADVVHILSDAELRALWAVTEHRMVSPYPAQMICVGYHGDADTDGVRVWWWVHGPYPDFFDDHGILVARCQGAAQADFGWFRPSLRLVQSERGRGR